MPKFFQFYPNRLTCSIFILSHFGSFCSIIIDRSVSRVSTVTQCSQILLHFAFSAVMGAKIKWPSGDKPRAPKSRTQGEELGPTPEHT